MIYVCPEVKVSSVFPENVPNDCLVHGLFYVISAERLKTRNVTEK